MFSKEQIVQQHEYQDIYRLEFGVLLKVNKFMRENYVSAYYFKEKLKKVPGLKNCYIVAETIYGYEDKYEKGTIIFENYIITPTNDPSKFFIELKFSGGSYTGDIGKIKSFTELIEEVINYYKDGGLV